MVLKDDFIHGDDVGGRAPSNVTMPEWFNEAAKKLNATPVFVVIDNGGTVPVDTPAGALVFEREAPP